jgi:hypothetical protein
MIGSIEKIGSLEGVHRTIMRLTDTFDERIINLDI